MNVDSAPLLTENTTVYDFSSKECHLLFDQTCGQQTDRPQFCLVHGHPVANSSVMVV